MEFYIKKNATLPLLKLQVVKDGRSDFRKFMDMIEVSALFFSMVDTETGIPKITSRPAGFVEKTFDDPNAETEYYIYYQFSPRDTNKVGRFEGQFMLRSPDGNLILPVREKLYINVQESFIADDLEYTSCYVSDFPCCVNGPYTTTTTTTPCPSCPTCPEPTPTPVTTTTTILPTTTTTTFTPINLNLLLIVTPGSVNLNYVFTSNIPVPSEVEINFTTILGTNTGSSITVSTGVTINQGNTEGQTIIVLDGNIFDLDGNVQFTNVELNFTGGTFNFNLNEQIIFIYPTPTPTPTPITQLLNPIITEEENTYIKIDENQYLMFVDPNIELNINVEVLSGSVNTIFTVTSNYPTNELITIPITAKLNLVGGGNISVSTNVFLLQNQTVAQSIVENPLLSYSLLDKTGEILVGQITPNNFPTQIQASQIQFEQSPTPTPTPTLTPTMTTTPTPTITPSSTPPTIVPLTIYIQPLSGGQSIIFDGVTYTSDTTVNVIKNIYYDITAVPIPGYMFVGWNYYGAAFTSITAETSSVTTYIDSGANIAPSYVVDPNYDALESQLSTNLINYQNAIDNDWVGITQQEYNNIANNVDGVVKIGNTDNQVNTRDSATGFQTTTFGTVDENTPLTIPAGYYVVGFVAESWNQNGGVQLGYTTTFHTGAPTYMSNTSNVIGGQTMFFVRKQPSGVEGAPASVDLYPILNFISPAYPNAVIGTYGWQTPDGGVTWLQTNPSQTAKIQLLITNVASWPI